MCVWIDLDNSPHVHFFAPIVRSLRARGLDVMITARHFGQTEELARSYGMDFVTIGSHRTPRYTSTRIAATCVRAGQLFIHGRRFRPTAALSHCSRALILAARMMRIPVMTTFDYEFSATVLATKISQKVLVPSEIPLELLRDRGYCLDKFVQYPGLKEEVYIYDFQPDPAILSKLGLDSDRLILTVRPPATWAHYHDALSERLLRATVSRLRKEKDAQVITIARTPEQAHVLQTIYHMDGRPFRVLTTAIDALSLMWYSDAVFSGGGTMVREAALMGVRTYSIFGGKLGAADLALIREGKLTAFRDPEQLESLPLDKHTGPPVPASVNTRTRDFIVDEFISFVEATKCVGRARHAAPAS